MNLQRAHIAGRSVPDRGWNRAYLAAFANASLFLILSFINKTSGVSGVGIHMITALIFFIGSIASFGLFLRNGGGLAAISFFVLGAGIYFGLGTATSPIVGSSAIYFLQYTPDEAERTLPAVNLLNAISVILVLLAAWPMSRRNYQKEAGAGIKNTLELLQPLTMPMLLLSIPVILFKIATFPLVQNLLLRNLLSNAETIILLSLVLSCMRWSTLQFHQKALPIFLFLTATLLGFLSTAKTEVLFPMLAVIGALGLDPRSRKLAAILAVSSFVAYFSIIGPLCNGARTHPLFNADDNTISERFEILSDVLSFPSQYSRASNSGLSLLSRFADAPIQAYLIERYDSGAPGHSMENAWEALVPRVVWPNKPNITRFGGELDGLFFSRDNSSSALGPTYSAEAYWNGGWVGVVIASILLGLEIGWLTRKWNLFVRDGMKHVGILAISIRVILASVWLETWFVATYVGGFVTLVILIKAADYSIPMLLRRSQQARHPLVFSARRMDRKRHVLP